MTKKLCARCDKIKPLSDYQKSSRLKLKVQSYCRECHSELDKKARARRKAEGPIIIRTSKECKLCNNIKPIGQFGIRRDTADGHLSYCKPCWNTYVKKQQLKHKK